MRAVTLVLAAVTLVPAVAFSDPPSASCRPQSAQPFLIRGNYIPWGRPARERATRQAAHLRAIAWRTEHYGYFTGFGDRRLNPRPPRYYAVTARFMGLPVRMHRAVVPALACVEGEIARTCAAFPYRPRSLAGIRLRNTYHTGEVTNHAYGIAIDIDPDRNTCCHCVGAWARHPLCSRRPTARTPFDRMAMPECWVRAFERYGFYWLGHDVLQDTMHFEFLGDPARLGTAAGTR